MDRPALCRALLALVGTARVDDLARLDAADWAAIDAMAATHRLRPLLHARHRDDSRIPVALRDTWQAAHRASAMLAMVQRVELRETVRLLDAANIPALVLKGGWLAWHAYPEAAQRPLRDIDLLLPEDRFLEGWDLLCRAGYVPAAEPDLPLDQLVQVDKSPPPLFAPRGTAIELHLHAWFPEGRLEYYSPPPDDAGLFARARRDEQGLLYPAPEDMLAHLVIHAIYSHRLDCGPLLLPDIAFLLERETLDWPAFWSRGQAAGWAGGARLVLDLVDRYCAPPALDLSAAPVPATPEDLLATAEELMLQNLDTRYSAGLAASGLTIGLKGLWPRITRRVSTGAGHVHHRDSTSDGGYLAWARSRLARTLSDLSDPAVRRQSRQLAQLSKWLDR